MKDALDLHSKSGIHRLITGLEERGFIKRLPHRARALEIIRMPQGLDTKGTKSTYRKTRLPGISMPDQPLLPGMSANVVAQSVSLPLYGRIAAGTPIEALSGDPGAHIDVPAGLLASNRGHMEPDEYYALEVAGDSMIEAGIMDGDSIIIQKCDTAENGTIVVALIEDNEATLKYIERRGSNQVALVPANKNYEAQLLPAEHVKVQGKVLGLLRRY
jgi:repressor LexA